MGRKSLLAAFAATGYSFCLQAGHPAKVNSPAGRRTGWKPPDPRLFAHNDMTVDIPVIRMKEVL